MKIFRVLFCVETPLHHVGSQWDYTYLRIQQDILKAKREALVTSHGDPHGNAFTDPASIHARQKELYKLLLDCQWETVCIGQIAV